MGIFKKLSGTVLNQFRITPALRTGAPSLGFHQKGEEHVDNVGSRFVCTEDGNPGTWKEVLIGEVVTHIHPTVGPLAVVDVNGNLVRSC